MVRNPRYSRSLGRRVQIALQTSPWRIHGCCCPIVPQKFLTLQSVDISESIISKFFSSVAVGFTCAPQDFLTEERIKMSLLIAILNSKYGTKTDIRHQTRSRQAFSQGPDSKQFGLSGPFHLCSTYRALLLQGKSSHKLPSNITLLTEIGSS